jgi:hypothetical protein
MGALDESLGAVELGILVATMLYGMSLVQAYRYFSINNKSDTLAIKLMVVFLWFVLVPALTSDHHTNLLSSTASVKPCTAA